MIDLVSVLERLGVEITAVGERRVFGLCPMHEERVGERQRTSHWSVDRQLLVHHCFSCGYKGTLAALIADLNNQTPDWAADWLAEHDRVTAFSRARKLGKAPDTGTGPPGPYRALERLLEGFCAPPDAPMERRQLERFAVNYYGVLWDPENRGWITPIRRQNGRLMGYQFKRRGFVRNHPVGVKKRTTLFGIDLFPEDGQAILVESPLDVVRLYSEGIAGGLAAFGALVSDQQVELLCAHASTVVLALDNDEEGQLQTQAMLGRLGRRLRVKVLDYGTSKAKDVGEMTREEIEVALTNSATPWGKRARQLA